MIGLKAYLPAFWSLPTLFLSQSAAAGSIGLINSVGNLGGALGPSVLGILRTWTGSFRPGLAYLALSMAIGATIVLRLGLGKRDVKPENQPDPLAEVLPETA
jgi:ACS family tartrate transporter-like MFS transporter